MIKLYISMEKFKGGPAVFRSRIANSLNLFDDIEIVTKRKLPFDIELTFIRQLHKHKKPCIARMDGCYYLNSTAPNDPLRDNVKRSKYVIYQSSFSRQMCHHFLGVRKPSKVIYNGIDFDFVKSIAKNISIEPGSFVASSHRWRDNKRPNSIIKGFLEANLKNHLYIVGDNVTEKFESKYVHYVGAKSPEDVISIMKACDYQIHLCHIDSCPNAVIEGLACGLNVLCTNLGGTPELVNSDGVILNVDKWKNKKILKQKFDNLDPKIVANGIHELIKIKTKPNRPDLDIKKVAEKYANVIRGVYDACYGGNNPIQL